MSSRGVNKAIIVGTLGQDPDVKYTTNNNTIVNVSVATNEEWKDKNTGEKVKKTEWHRIVVFGKLAEICAQYLKKGGQVYFEGKIQTRKWQDESGNDKWTTEIVANEMQMLGGKPVANPTSDESSSQQSMDPQGQTVDEPFDDIPF